MDLLRKRAALLRSVRHFFESQGSIEVETPALVVSPGLDAHIDAIEAGGWRLTTSPEFHMKRLLAAGSGPIHQIGKAWRAGECGPHHEPEFTLLEFDGTARRIAVTSDARLAHVAFEPDGRAVILAGEGVDGPVLLRSDLSGQTSLLHSSLEGAFERPVVGGPGGRLAFAVRTDESDVWRLSGLR